MAIGIACSLAILQPKTVPGCLCAMTGGMIGGMISDIDSPGKRQSLDYSEDPYGWQVFVFIGLPIHSGSFSIFSPSKFPSVFVINFFFRYSESFFIP